MAHAKAAVDTGMTAPVMLPAASEARKATTPATSSAEASRPSGTLLRISALVLSGSTAVMSVSTKPGATTLQVMFRDASSLASERARPTRPALDEA